MKTWKNKPIDIIPSTAARQPAQALSKEKTDLEQTLNILKALPADAAIILALQKRAFLSQAAIYDNYQLPPLTQTQASIEQDFSAATFLKAVLQERILGAVRYVQVEGTIDIERLVVEPAYQNRGIGTRLLAAVESRCPKGCTLRLFTGDRSSSNLYLYRKLGYNVTSRHTTDQGITLVYLEKELPLRQSLPG